MIGGVEQIGDGVIVGSGIHKSRRAGAFTEDDKTRYAVVMSHAARALQIADRIGTLSSKRALGLEVAHSLDVGLMLLDASCRPVFLNGVAEGVIRRAVCLCLSNGRVRAVHADCKAGFRKTVAHAAATSGGQGLSTGGILRLRGSTGTGMRVIIAPFRTRDLGFGPMNPVAAVVFADPDKKLEPDPEALARAFGLTRAEARIVVGLAAGKSLVATAKDAGISINTAKRQLSSVFAKTGHFRQTSLIAEVLSDPIVRGTLAASNVDRGG